MDFEKLQKYVDEFDIGFTNAEVKERRKKESQRMYNFIRKYERKKDERRQKGIVKTGKPLDVRVLERYYSLIMRKVRQRNAKFYDRRVLEKQIYSLNRSAQWKKTCPRGTVTPYKFEVLLRKIMRKKVEQYIKENEEMETGVKDNEKLKILCIVGTSGSGKTLASLHLKYKLGANVICSFTTRPPRETEVSGRDHYFIDVVPEEKDVLAMTKYGEYLYYALKSQVFGPCTVYVIDEDGIRDLMDVHGDKYRLFKVYLKRSPSEKKKSAIHSNRTRRDKDRVPFPMSFYDWVIDNNTTKRHLFEEIEKIYNYVKELD